MHRVRAWAHSSAFESKFNPWNEKSTNQPVPPPSTTPDGATLEQTPQGDTAAEKPKKPAFRRFLSILNIIFLHSWVNLLLVFVPAGIAVHFAGVNPNVVFALNAIAVIPLAGLLTFATESVAHRLGPTLGALLNVSFGNAVELIIFIIALVKNEIRVVQASLIGSILANLLLILGMAFLIGGLEYREQVYDSLVTQMSACLLALAVLSLLIPTAFHASFSNVQLADDAVLKISRGTSVILLLVYVLYLLFQLKSHSYLYQGTPQHIIDEAAQPGFLARFDSSPTTSSVSSRRSSISHSTASSSGGTRRRVSRKIKSKLGRKRTAKTEVESIQETEISEVPKAANKGEEKEWEPVKGHGISGAKTEPAAVVAANTALPAVRPNKPGVAARGLSFRPPPVFRASTNPLDPNANILPPHQLRRLRSEPFVPRNADGTPVIPGGNSRTNTGASKEPVETDDPPIGQTTSIVLLLCSTGLVALCAEFLVGSIEHLVASSPLSEAFVGLIILPIVGNAAEHVTAVTVAAKNKLDLALGVSLGSSIQIALFVTPLIVIIGWIMDKSMSLYFNLFEVASLFASTFIVNFLVLDGRSNYLEGALLCACYIIIAVGAYFYPDGQDQSALSGGTGAR